MLVVGGAAVVVGGDAVGDGGVVDGGAATVVGGAVTRGVVVVVAARLGGGGGVGATDRTAGVGDPVAEPAPVRSVAAAVRSSRSTPERVSTSPDPEAGFDVVSDSAPRWAHPIVAASAA